MLPNWPDKYDTIILVDIDYCHLEMRKNNLNF